MNLNLPQPTLPTQSPATDVPIEEAPEPTPVVIQPTGSSQSEEEIKIVGQIEAEEMEEEEAEAEEGDVSELTEDTAVAKKMKRKRKKLKEAKEKKRSKCDEERSSGQITKIKDPQHQH